MTNWTEFDLTTSLPRLRQRFPGMSMDTSLCPVTQSDAFVAALASAQGISLTEAREEIDDFLYMESLRAELIPSDHHATHL
ncbi:hypothetical protein [Tritonibacter horizontis]|uniref:Uncharacterized protein n=1 Tax=Tritonibacter horizontis TaxID=1768241 RepID=A0A132BXM4_9RHOB|nr:hypothetical protein [Tritonibacter horizontis]KUP92567.1 hypothetical protein TRIHO_25370 [Tritonibacter horizontis]